MDIDHFKRINDTYGHDAGDFILKSVAQTLKSNLRKSDLIARYGGEEFVVACTNLQREQTLMVFDKLRAAIEAKTFHYDGQDIEVRISIGVSTVPGASVMECLKKADQNLYHAKEAGRNQVVIDKDEVDQET